MAITWPAGLKYQPMRGSWACSQRNVPPISSPMNSGTDRLRNPFTMRVASMSFDITFNATEQAAFNTFLDTTLAAGSARFDMPVWNGSAFVTRAVRFKTPPKTSEFAYLVVRVSFDLLVENL